MLKQGHRLTQGIMCAMQASLCESAQAQASGSNSVGFQMGPLLVVLSKESAFWDSHVLPGFPCHVRYSQMTCLLVVQKGINVEVLFSGSRGHARFGVWPWRAFLAQLQRRSDAYPRKPGGTTAMTSTMTWRRS